MSEGENPKVTIEYDAQTSLAEKKLKALEERVKAQEAVYNTLSRRAQRAAKQAADASEGASKRSKKANKERAESAENAAKKEIKWLHQTRWDIITLMFYYRLLSAAARTAYKLIQESLETGAERAGARVLARSYGLDLGGLAEQFRAITGNVIDEREAIQAVQQGMLQDQGQFAGHYVELWRAAMIGGAATTEDAKDMFSSFIEALAQGDAEVIDSQTNIYQAQLAVQKYAESVGVTVKELDPLIKAQVIYNAIMDETDRLAAAGGDALLTQDAALKSVASSWQILRDVVGTVGKELLGTGSSLDTINSLLTTMSQLMIIVSANAAHFKANIELLQPGKVPLGVGGPAVMTIRAIWALVSPQGIRERRGEETPEEAYNRVMTRGAEALGFFQDQVDNANRTYERFRESEEKNVDYTSIVDQIEKRSELFEDHARRIDEIEKSRTARIEKIEKDHEAAMLRIHRDAFSDRLEAARDYSRRVRESTAQFNLRERQELEDHLRDLRQKEEQYQLDRLHDQAMYNYERMMLVAEGDVLAIEDLDARFKLEQDAASDNHKVQQRQRQEDYEDEKRQRREQFDLELKEMLDAYQERLREISIREQELIDEQIQKRYEALQEAQDIYEEDLRQEQDRHDESLLEWDRYWAVLAERTELGADAITKIIQAYFGEGGEADQITQNFMDRWLERQQMLTNIQSIAPGRSTASTGPTTLFRTPPEGAGGEILRYWQYAQRGYQFGGSGVARRPMLLPIGETPERFTVEPLASTGHQIALSWTGGPIPVQGSGLQGANLSGLGDAIAQGLSVALISQFQGARR